MSDPTRPDDPGFEERDELLAAEYVLGTLPGAEREDARQRAEVDGAFAARIRAWEGRLSPLNDNYDDAPAPDLLPQIEGRLFGTRDTARTRPARRGWLSLGWFGAGAITAVLAIVAVFFVLTFAPPGPSPAILQAELATEDTDLRFAARFDASTGLLEISRAAGDAAPDGQDYELWAIDADGVPRSLGLLRAPLEQVQTALVAGITLAVSLEPEGGSPEPAPTGPVLAVAALTEI